MKTLISTLFFILLIVQASFSQNESLKNDLVSNELSSEEIYSRCKNAAVMIYKFDRDNALLGYGSGVIVSGSGLVYTNYHVVEGAYRVEIRNGNDIYDSIPFAGINPFIDAAILKLPEGNYTFVNIPSVNDYKIGSSIYALGNPQGYTKTISYGIISALRSNDGPNQIQFTAPIAPGSSGGALLNTNGELIGITTSCVTIGQNMNFAVPIKAYLDIPIADLSDPTQKELLRKLIALYTNTERIDFDNSDEIISNYINLYKNDTAKWEFAGQFYFSQGADDSAVKCFTRSIELTNNNQFLYKLRGDCYQNINDTVNTLSDYAESLTICPSSLNTYVARANYYHYVLREYDKAIEDYNMILKLNPEYDYVYTQKASCKIGLNDKLGAISELSKSLCWKTSDPLIYNMRAEIYSTLEMYDNAIADYTSSILCSPQQTDLYLHRAVMYSKKRDNANAIRDYMEYIKYYPDDPTAYNNVAYAYMDLEKYEESEKFFKSSIDFDIHHFDSYLGLAILNHRLGKTKSSIQNMCKAIEIKDILLNGMPGLTELENSGWFWDKDEKKDVKSIFKLMGITDSKIETVKEPKARRIKREAARN